MGLILANRLIPTAAKKEEKPPIVSAKRKSYQTPISEQCRVCNSVLVAGFCHIHGNINKIPRIYDEMPMYAGGLWSNRLGYDI